MTTEPSTPQLWFRLAVLAGGTCLVLGIVAAVRIILDEEDLAPAAGPGLSALVRIEGAPRGIPLTVAATWEEASALVTQGARRLEGGAEVWILPPCPEGVQVTVLVHDVTEDPPRLLGRSVVDVQPGVEAVVDVAPAAGG